MRFTVIAFTSLGLLAACGDSGMVGSPANAPVAATPLPFPTPAAPAASDPAKAPTADGSKSHMARKPVTGFTAHDPAVPLNFLIIGDAGTQDNVQNALGLVMRDVCAAKTRTVVPGCHFALAAGDNIYFVGAANPTDPQFLTAFENPYAPLTLPFYLVLGNHDNGAIGSLVQLGDNQVEYSHRSDRMSKKWNMPARYYTQRFGGVLELFAIDGDTIPGPGDADAYDGDLQQAFFKEALKLSPARWKMSMTHYNYISNGNYGDGAADFKAALENTICDKVQFHIQGHEHDMRWLKPVASCGRTEFIVSGAGGRTEARPATNLGFEERKGQGGKSDYRASSGFMWASILGDTITVEWYGDNAESANPPRPVEKFVLTRAELGFTD